MRKGHSQSNASLLVHTALGADALLLDSLQGNEGLSKLFSFTLTMRASSSTLSAADVIGKAANVTIQHDTKLQRHIHGIISRFTYLGSAADFSLYTAELVPAMWLMTLGRDRVIYQNLTAPEIIKAVLNEHRIQYKTELTGSYGEREYCVRYDESAFDFISRLMEDEGIFYYFVHDKNGHKLVLADNNAAFKPCPNAQHLTMLNDMATPQSAMTVYAFELDSRLTLKTHIVDDYNYLTPSTSLLSKEAGPKDWGSDYEFPGRHQDLSTAQARARLRVETHQSGHEIGKGESGSPHIYPGGTFTLSDHIRTQLNAVHVVSDVQHQTHNGQYTNRFSTFNPTQPHRPLRKTALPVVWGNHIAKVVGSPGEEIWTDVHGRIKVQFPWDRTGKQDDKSSCWIRVSQIWAGQGWGALFIPRIGQEVVISYLDGDPDRPLVTGSVYNAEQTPPINLPTDSTQSTIRSRSSKKGFAGNEMRFEDKLDSEQLYMHAQKDMLVEVENDLTTTVIAGNELHQVQQGDRTVTVDTGKETHTVQGTRELEITGHETHVNKSNFKQTVTGTRDIEVTGNEKHINKANFSQNVTGNYELKILGNLVIDVTGSITLKSAQSIGIKAALNMNSESGVSMQNKSGVTMTNEAPKIDSRASGLHYIEAGGVLSLKGALVKIN